MKRKPEGPSPHERLKYIGLLFLSLGVWCASTAFEVGLFLIGWWLFGQCAWMTALGLVLMNVSVIMAIFEILTPIKILAAMYAVWTSPYFIRDEQLAKMRRERAKARAAAARKGS